MKATATAKPASPAGARKVKRPYKRPDLREFGKLHVMTQSSGPMNGDGGQSMMM